jgi:pimeloyl-ACP methyl ester carboxylesterase
MKHLKKLLSIALAGTLAIGVLTGALSSKRDFKSETLETGEGTLHYITMTPYKEMNDTILFIHGAGESSEIFKPLMSSLKGYNVVSLDLPGRNGSYGSGKTSVKEYADVVETAIQKLKEKGFENFTIVGHSMGSLVTLDLSSRNISDIKGAVLIAGEPAAQLPNELIEALKSNEVFKSIVYSSLTSSTTKEDRKYIDKNFNNYFAASGQVRSDDFKAGNGFDMTEQLAQIHTPIQIISGDKDALISVESQLLMLRKLPNAYLSIVPNRGHLMVGELSAIDGISNTIKEFIHLENTK